MIQIQNQTVKPICGEREKSRKTIPKKTFTAEEIRAKLLSINPQIIYNSKYTNPFLYQDTKEWYNELEKYI